jgi:hypothetical protein
VFMHVARANPGSEQEAALVALSDVNGLSLGRYVVSRDRLDDALGRAEDVVSEDSDPAVVPAEWAG